MTIARLAGLTVLASVYMYYGVVVAALFLAAVYCTRKTAEIVLGW